MREGIARIKEDIVLHNCHIWVPNIRFKPVFDSLFKIKKDLGILVILVHSICQYFGFFSNLDNHIIKIVINFANKPYLIDSLYTNQSTDYN
jgi:hypothetical protein